MAAVHAVQHLACRAMGLKLTIDQAEALWAECRPRMPYEDIVLEIEGTGNSGRLDTMPRDDLLNAIANVLAGQDWPCNMDGEQVFRDFVAKLGDAIRARGYELHEETAATPHPDSPRQGG